MEKLLCPSMMCAHFGNLEKEVNELDEAGVDIFPSRCYGWKFCTKLWYGITRYRVYHSSNSKTM